MSIDGDQPEVIIVGSGLGGLCAARELRNRGRNDFVILERSDAIGGVWRENRYPGVACDTPVELYAFSWHPGSHWSKNFAPGAEMLAYFNEVIREYDLTRHIVLNTDVASATWDDGEARWTVTATGGRVWKPRFLIWAGGILSRPHIPELPGKDAFAGAVVHTAQWGDGIDLTGKRVAVVGGGATSIQVLPWAVARAEHVYAFIRTPSHVLPKDEEHYDDDYRLRLKTDRSVQSERRKKWQLWADESAKARFPMNEDFITEMEERWRGFFEGEIADPELRRLLTPPHRFSCRRPTVSNEYYKAFTQPNVTVIGDGLAALSEHAAIASDGRTFDVDAVILATGFTPKVMLGSLDVIGRNGRRLAEAWSSHPEAYRGVLAKGFPNLFFINGPNVGAPAVTEMVEAQVGMIAMCIEHVGANGAGSIEVTPQAHDDYNRDLQERLAESVLTSCSSWYRAGGTGAVFTHFPGTTKSFQVMLSELSMRDLAVAPAREPEGSIS